MFSTLRGLPLLPDLLASPVVTDLHWSPLVHGAVQRNLRAWGWVAGVGSDNRSSARSALQEQHRADTSLAADTQAPLRRLLALHLRRGDFDMHCATLAYYNATWQSINAAEGVVDP
jgi:hypothetical protein